MNKRYLIGFLIIIAGLVYLGTTVFRSSLQYYVTVSELESNVSRYLGKTLKVAGKVKMGSLVKIPGDQPTYQFVLVEAGQELSIIYRGLIPDTFKAGSDVVATGRLDAGQFVAHHILAKCASKYEAKVQS